MKALITRGKFKGKVFEVSQWCNDWFTLRSNIQEVAVKPFSPSSLAFTIEDMHLIEEHKNNGMLFAWFEVKRTPPELGEFFYTFKRRKNI